MDNVSPVDLHKKGISKYRIAKELNVSWNTVSLWIKGVYKPTSKHQRRLNEKFRQEEDYEEEVSQDPR